MMNKPQPILHQIGNLQIADYGETTNAKFGDKHYPKYTLFVKGINWYYVFGNFPFAGLELMRDFELMKTFAEDLQKLDSFEIIENYLNGRKPTALESIGLRAAGLALERLLLGHALKPAPHLLYRINMNLEMGI